jgi:hypothetical protein
LAEQRERLFDQIHRFICGYVRDVPDILGRRHALSLSADIALNR